MISIIVAVYNQLEMNKLFVESLNRYSTLPFELIIIDNGSTDGSAEFFEGVGAKVIRNSGNYSYPVCQNIGIKNAKYDIYAFLNNDIIVSPKWDERFVEVMKRNGLDIVTSCGIERMESKQIKKFYRKKWSKIKELVGFFFGQGRFSLKLMHRLMYGNWEQFCEKRFSRFGYRAEEAFVGNCVIMTKRAVELIGLWDERIQAADYDLYLRSKKRSLETGDIKPVHVALGIWVHHYIRLTVKGGYPPFVDRANIISPEEKWGEQTVENYLSYIKI
ncbi:MAG: glycosyltransferase family 2 protein [Campylobacterales bacterium]